MANFKSRWFVGKKQRSQINKQSRVHTHICIWRCYLEVCMVDAIVILYAAHRVVVYCSSMLFMYCM